MSRATSAMTDYTFAPKQEGVPAVDEAVVEPEEKEEPVENNELTPEEEKPSQPELIPQVDTKGIRDEIEAAIVTKNKNIVNDLEKLKEQDKNFKLPAKTEDQRNLMYLACYYYDDNTALKVCELLFGMGEELETSKKWGITPVFQAAKSGLEKTFDFLINKGANIEKEVLNNIVYKGVPFQVSILDYALSGKNPNPSIIKKLEAKGVKKVSEGQQSNVNTNDKHIKTISQASFDFSNLPSDFTTTGKDEALAIIENLVKAIESLPSELKELLVSAIKVTSPEKSKELQIVSAKDFSRVLSNIKNGKVVESSNLIKDPSIYTLTEDYEDTPYYHLVAMSVVDVLKEPMPGKAGRTIEKYVVSNLANPASPFLPANTERLDTFTDYLAAVIFKIFMRAQTAEGVFNKLHEQIMDEYGPTTSKGGKREITGTVYSCGFVAADFLEENLFSKDVSLKRQVEEIYEDIKSKVSDAFDMEDSSEEEKK